MEQSPPPSGLRLLWALVGAAPRVRGDLRREVHEGAAPAAPRRLLVPLLQRGASRPAGGWLSQGRRGGRPAQRLRRRVAGALSAARARAEDHRGALDGGAGTMGARARGPRRLPAERAAARRGVAQARARYPGVRAGPGRVLRGLPRGVRALEPREPGDRACAGHALMGGPLADELLQPRLQRILQTREGVDVDQLDERRDAGECRRGQNQIVCRSEGRQAERDRGQRELRKISRVVRLNLVAQTGERGCEAGRVRERGLSYQRVHDELSDVLAAALALAGEPLPHLRERVAGREADDPAHGRGDADRLRLPVGLGLVRVFPRVERDAIADERQPMLVELGRDVERLRGKRLVALLELGEGAIRAHRVALRAEEFAEQALGGDDRAQGLEVRRELFLQKLRDDFGLAPELGELLERQGLGSFGLSAHVARVVDAQLESSVSTSPMYSRLSEAVSEPIGVKSTVVPLSDRFRKGAGEKGAGEVVLC